MIVGLETAITGPADPKTVTRMSVVYRNREKRMGAVYHPNQ